jgi:gluconolactonase
MLRIVLALMLALPVSATGSPAGSVRASTPDFWRLVSRHASVQTVAQGFTWAEGPVWVRDGGYLLLSDVPKNRIYRWSPGDTAPSVFIEPSGPSDTRGLREAGTNGLKAGPHGFILAAGSGDRAITLINVRTKAKRLLVQRFDGKRFNSPNDLAVGADGSIWFTDPPYGLEGIEKSPLKEQPADRVYRLSPDGRVTAEESDLAFPNGIAFSPDGRTLYVSNSDPKQAVIIAWDVSPSGKLSHRRVFADMTTLASKELPGLPDGMTVDEHGDLWASGPGGIHVLAPDGRELGLISTGVAISNCTFGGADGRTLFMTSTHQLVALRTNVRGGPVRLPKLSGLRK